MLLKCRETEIKAERWGYSLFLKTGIRGLDQKQKRPCKQMRHHKSVSPTTRSRVQKGPQWQNYYCTAITPGCYLGSIAVSTVTTKSLGTRRK